MECFYRNETLHQIGLVGWLAKRKLLHDNELELGMPYASHTLEGGNSFSRGSYDVCSPCPSLCHPDCERAGGSRLWRLQPVYQSRFIQSKAPSTDPYGPVFLLNVIERPESPCGQVGTRSFRRSAKCFTADRTGRGHAVAPRIGFYHARAERRAHGAYTDHRRLQSRTACRLRHAAARSAVSQTRDFGARSPEYGGLRNGCGKRYPHSVLA